MAGSDVMSRARNLERIPWDVFEDFYGTKWSEVYRTLSVVIRDPDLAREATDEAMVRAYQRWSTVRRYDNPGGWVYRVALNWARSRMRRARRVSNYLPDQVVDPDLAVDPSVHDALAGLPLHQREVVVLHYLFDLSGPEIATMLGIAEGTVRSRLHRALDALREELPDDV
jgi:RNA polymerase sigma-70 factor (sigma-E family)